MTWFVTLFCNSGIPNPILSNRNNLGETYICSTTILFGIPLYTIHGHQDTTSHTEGRPQVDIPSWIHFDAFFRFHKEKQP